jgi:plasmid stabilization system protein ParE
MAKQVILTPVALANYQQIIEYLTDNWGVNVAKNLMERFEKVAGRLSKTPHIYPLVNENNNIRSCVLTKHNIIYFKEYETAIKILMIFDTRQDPSKLVELL